MKGKRVGRHLRSRTVVAFLAAFLLVLAQQAGATGAPGTIDEFTLTTPNGLPRELTRGPDGALWFTMESGFPNELGIRNNGGIGRIAVDGTTTEYPIPQRGGPKAIAAGSDGALWYTGVVVPHAGINWPVIGRVTTTGSFSSFLLPANSAGVPEGRPDSIVAGPDSALWFTDSGGHFDASDGKSYSQIGRITTSGVFSSYRIPTPGAGPRGLTVGPDGNIWFVEQGGNKVGRLDMATKAIAEFAIPTARSQPIQIVAGPDGNLWFGAGSVLKIDRITTAGVITEFPSGLGSGVQGGVGGPDGNVWFAVTGAGRLAKVTPAGTVTSFAIPSTSGVLPVDVEVGADGNIWFTERSDNQIGRFNLLAQDTEPPTLTVPADKTVEATSPAGATVTYPAASASDTVDPSPQVSCSPASGGTFPLGATTVSCEATDTAGNKSTKAFVVKVVDTTAPTLAVPDDQTVEATSPAGATVTYPAALATDAVSTPVIHYSKASGAVFPLGTTTVEVTATDAAGNTSTASFVVEVVDTTAPDIIVQADITLDATSPSGRVVTYEATAQDIVDGAVTPTCTPAPGSTFAAGDTTVTCDAVDHHGNASSKAFQVHVRGAAEQLDRLIDDSTDVGPGTSLADKARDAAAALEADDVTDACATLKAYRNQVHAQAGKKLTAEQAEQLASAAERIRAVIGC